jgi:hypothetical protein
VRLAAAPLCLLAAVAAVITVVCGLAARGYLQAQADRQLRACAAARTDWESITAAVGSVTRPAAWRAAARNASCKAIVTPRACHRWYRP